MSTDATFDSAGVEIAVDDVGNGDPVVLVHGYASSRHGTWRDRGWYEALADAGRRVVALDCRGHGASGKPHDPAAYDPDAMAGDVVRLLDHLGIETADLLGYSMGARISMHLLVDHGDRVGAAVLAGVGAATLRQESYSGDIADALEADDPADVEDPTARDFREFAEGRANDLAALAACRRASQAGMVLDEADLATISRPVLVVAGGADELVGDPGPLADAVPGATAETVPGRDHLTTVGDDRFRDVVLDFLARH